MAFTSYVCTSYAAGITIPFLAVVSWHALVGQMLTGHKGVRRHVQVLAWHM